jgi:hypothetical protein
VNSLWLDGKSEQFMDKSRDKIVSTWIEGEYEWIWHTGPGVWFDGKGVQFMDKSRDKIISTWFEGAYGWIWYTGPGVQ